MSLDSFFTPRSVAVIGASHTPAKLGYTIFENFVDGEFKGKYYPVNRNTTPILGHKVYPSVKKIPGSVDLAVISLPAPIVPVALKECGQKGVKGVIIISGGFAELGEEGRKLEDEIREVRKKYGMRIIGPNCISGESFTLIKNDDHTKHIEIGSFIDNLFEANKDKAVNVSGTYVLPSSATGKNIKILSYKDGRYQFKKILNFFKRRGTAAKVVLEDGKELVCSPDHPFLVKTPKGMETRLCKYLGIGDMVPLMSGSAREAFDEKTGLTQGRTDGSTYFRKIKSIERLDGETDLYDFEVEDSHTFVADQIITHNCMGVLDLYNNMDTLFMPGYRLRRPRKGGISFISQSGAFGIATMDWAEMRNIGINKFISFGNKVDVNETECLEFLADDPHTKCIAMYVESIEDGRRFLKVAKKVSMKKPIVCLKAGVTEDGAKAVRSHTGSMAGSARVYSAAFRQAGVIQADEIGELFDLVRALALQPKPKGDRIVVVTDGGAFGVMATDAATKYGLKMAQLPEETKERLRKVVSSHAVVENPIDLTGDASTDMYSDVLHIVAEEPGVDGIIAICLLQVPTISSKIVGVLTDVSKTYGKPLVACMMGGEFTDLHMRMLEEDNIPAFETPHRAVEAMSVLARYGRYIEDSK